MERLVIEGGHPQSNLNTQRLLTGFSYNMLCKVCRCPQTRQTWPLFKFCREPVSLMHPGTLFFLLFTLLQSDQTFTIKCAHKLQTCWNLYAHTQTNILLVCDLTEKNWYHESGCWGETCYGVQSVVKRNSAHEKSIVKKYVRILAFVRNVTCRRRKNIV